MILDVVYRRTTAWPRMHNTHGRHYGKSQFDRIMGFAEILGFVKIDGELVKGEDYVEYLLDEDYSTDRRLILPQPRRDP